MKSFHHVIILILFFNSACSPDEKVIPENPTQVESIKEIFEFNFDENFGNTISEKNTGANYNIIGNGINWMNGVSGSAIFFDGLSNELVGTLPSSNLPTNKLAFSLWVSPKSYPIGTAAIITLTAKDSENGVTVGLNKYGQIVVQYFINGVFSEVITTDVLPRDKWNHLVVGINPSKQNLKIYLNNLVIKNTSVASGNISWATNSVPVSIGKNTQNQTSGLYNIDYYSGAIDEIKILEGELSQEVVDNINSAYSPPTEVQYENNIDYSNDNNRPKYHAIPDYGWANESYGLVYYGGKYHMFFQKNDVFLGISQQNWGHFTSVDLVDWYEENAVLWPTEGWDNFGIWSGDAVILNDGTPAVIYTGVNGVKAGIGTAISNDNYQTLIKNTSNPVIPAAPSDVNMDFRDPYVWKKNNEYHMIIGSGISSKGGNVVYYKSTDFNNWDYQGIAFQGNKNKGQGEFWEMPVLHEFPNGKEMLLLQKTPDATPAITTYWIGQFENGVFTPDFEEPKKLEVVNGFLSPAVAKDMDGNVTAIGIIPDEVKAKFQMDQGWANLFSIPQVWELDNNNDILIKPHPNLKMIRGDKTSFSGLEIKESNSNYLNGYNGRHFEMEASINIGNANEIGIILGKSPNGEEEYRVYYDVSAQQWVVDASKSSLSDLVRKDIRRGSYNIAANSTINLRIFVDGSVLEVFIDDKSHFTGRFFPTMSNANNVDLFVKGGEASADISIYELNN
ncbi:GH32 C-terminal domain-containing protein [Polaribacter sp.]|uniref:GH32 C-terminal domain-containing protein n=1 Tax=Polaribacter sp. TaxID=1920175 RepID=UPI003F6C31B0